MGVKISSSNSDSDSEDSQITSSSFLFFGALPVSLSLPEWDFCLSSVDSRVVVVGLPFALDAECTDEPKLWAASFGNWQLGGRVPAGLCGTRISLCLQSSAGGAYLTHPACSHLPKMEQGR